MKHKDKVQLGIIYGIAIISMIVALTYINILIDNTLAHAVKVQLLN